MGLIVPEGGSSAEEAPAAPWKVRGPALRVDVPFEIAKAELDERARRSLDEVHAAYVKERCWFVLIGGRVAPDERRRGLGKDLALSRSGAVGSYLIDRGIPSVDVRVFEKPDFLKANGSDPAQGSKEPSAVAYCPEPRPAAACRGEDTDCTSGATVRTELPDSILAEGRFELCLGRSCSALVVDLGAMSRVPHQAVLARMHGELPAALLVVHEATPRTMANPNPRAGRFFVEARGGIGKTDLTDGDVYSLKVYVGQRDIEGASVVRAALYRDWIPSHAPSRVCKDASFPGKPDRNIPLHDFETGFW